MKDLWSTFLKVSSATFLFCPIFLVLYVNKNSLDPKKHESTPAFIAFADNSVPIAPPGISRVLASLPDSDKDYKNAFFTKEQCSSADVGTLYGITNAIASKVDSELVPSKFAKVSSGYFIMVVDESGGTATGGGQNPDGIYFSYVLNGDEVLPEGACALHAKDGGLQCGPYANYPNATLRFSLGPSDAIALVSCTPFAPMRYFSHDVLISMRTSTNPPFYPGQCFGDTVSSLTINVSTPEDLFNSPSLIIHSADGAAADLVKSAYMKYRGIEEDAVSIRGIPGGNPVNLWDRSKGLDWRDSSPDLLG